MSVVVLVKVVVAFDVFVLVVLTLVYYIAFTIVIVFVVRDTGSKYREVFVEIVSVL